jgi:hypothetical protein
MILAKNVMEKFQKNSKKYFWGLKNWNKLVEYSESPCNFLLNSAVKTLFVYRVVYVFYV